MTLDTAAKRLLTLEGCVVVEITRPNSVTVVIAKLSATSCRLTTDTPLDVKDTVANLRRNGRRL